MKKKVLIVSIILILVLAVAGGIFYINSNKTDAMKFKKEYESLNGKKKNEKTIRSITIPKENPIVYSDAKEIVRMINNQETFAVYFGFSNCPWCRSVLPTLLEVCKDENVKKLYYVDVEEIRDVLTVNDEGKVETEEKGSTYYYKLLEKLDAVLEDYTLKDKDGNDVDTNEKRIYAPNVVSIVNGEAKELTSGISDDQTDGYAKITAKMKKTMYNKFKCTLECLNEKKAVCETKAC